MKTIKNKFYNLSYDQIKKLVKEYPNSINQITSKEIKKILTKNGN